MDTEVISVFHHQVLASLFPQLLTKIRSTFELSKVSSHVVGDRFPFMVSNEEVMPDDQTAPPTDQIDDRR